MAYPERVADELVELRYAIYTRPDTDASLKEVFNNTFLGAATPNQIEEDELKEIKAPALVLWSDKNPGAGVDAGERLSRHFEIQATIVSRMRGHWPQWEQPEDHDRAVIDFLDRPVR